MLASVQTSRVAARVSTNARSAASVCRATVEPRAAVVLSEGPACACAAEMSAMATKTKCIHPQRPISQACPDCPRRKGKAMSADDAMSGSALQTMAKAKCVHPTRPVSQACADCPRRKGKSAMSAESEGTLKACSAMQTMAGKTKCVHPQRPVASACPDCPRRR